MDYLLPYFQSIFLGISTLFCLILLFIQRKKLSSGGLLDDYSQDSLKTLSEAARKAQDILGNAELEGVKIAADARVETRKFENTFEDKLAKALANFDQAMNQGTVSSQNEFVNFLNDLRVRSEQAEIFNQEVAKQRTNEIFDKFEQNLSKFLTETQQKSVMSIQLEMEAARTLIETYKSQKFKLVDENIIAILEETLSLVIAKKLNFQDQMDIVYEALEKAKVDKFLI